MEFIKPKHDSIQTLQIAALQTVLTFETIEQLECAVAFLCGQKISVSFNNFTPFEFQFECKNSFWSDVLRSPDNTKSILCVHDYGKLWDLNNKNYGVVWWNITYDELIPSVRQISTSDVLWCLQQIFVYDIIYMQDDSPIRTIYFEFNLCNCEHWNIVIHGPWTVWWQ